MGKNKGKKGKKTPYARFQSIMAKLDNRLAVERAEEVKASKAERAKAMKPGVENGIFT